MNTRSEILTQIHRESLTAGLAAALRLARDAVNADSIDRFDIPEIFLALRTGSWRFFEESGRLPGAAGHHAARAA